MNIYEIIIIIVLVIITVIFFIIIPLCLLLGNSSTDVPVTNPRPRPRPRPRPTPLCPDNQCFNSPCQRQEYDCEDYSDLVSSYTPPGSNFDWNLDLDLSSNSGSNFYNVDVTNNITTRQPQPIRSQPQPQPQPLQQNNLGPYTENFYQRQAVSSTDSFNIDFSSSSNSGQMGSFSFDNTPDFRAVTPSSNETSEPIIDSVIFSNYTIRLFPSGKIIRSDIRSDSKEETVIRSNIKASQIETFSGYIYAVSEGQLYKLRNEDLDKSEWLWRRIKWGNDISYIKSISTNPGKNLFLIESKTDYHLLDANMKIMDRGHLADGWNRRYGLNQDIFVEYNTLTGEARTSSNQSFNDCYFAIYDTFGNLVKLGADKTSQGIRSVKMVGWNLIYL